MTPAQALVPDAPWLAQGRCWGPAVLTGVTAPAPAAGPSGLGHSPLPLSWALFGLRSLDQIKHIFELQIQEMFLTKNVFSRCHGNIVKKPGFFGGKKGKLQVQEASGSMAHEALPCSALPGSLHPAGISLPETTTGNCLWSDPGEKESALVCEFRF